ncbi:MAG: glycoside hydrolase family 5 protein [Candidatus Eremiobacteraeota bacterium]|nr:glycoside hydrolase family 5 protein [Candidatus Eremiobacteraeota bacterium]
MLIVVLMLTLAAAALAGAGRSVSRAQTPGYTVQAGIVHDPQGNPVQLRGVNWFGFETGDHVVHGLWARNWRDMIAQMKSLGFNAVRLPFCPATLQGASVSSINYSLNPDLAGKNSLQILDLVMAELDAQGLYILADHHRPDCNAISELWYTNSYSEEQWIADLVFVAERYAHLPHFFAVDLKNEPHGAATWGSGDPATDWRLAAQKAGNAILSVNPHMLIIVEGVEQTGGAGYWWGGNLRSAGTSPIVLQVPNQLVYSTHDYPSTIAWQPWFSDPSYPNNLPLVWDDRWGYLVKNNVAPVLVGELGTKYQTASDKAWLGKLASYIQASGLSFTYWCLNPNSGDTGGILADDWVTVNQNKQAVIQPLLAPIVP